MTMINSKPVKSSPALLDRLQAAVDAFKALPPEARKAVMDAQKAQWIKDAVENVRSSI